mgnify:CR=1 FL=1
MNDANFKIVMRLPFTVGTWQDSKPVTVALNAGEDTLRFWRNRPPQYGLGVNEFTLAPVK